MSATPYITAGNLTALVWAGQGQDSIPGLLRDAADWLDAQDPEDLIVWTLLAEVREDSQKGDETAVTLTVEMLGGER